MSQQLIPTPISAKDMFIELDYEQVANTADELVYQETNAQFMPSIIIFDKAQKGVKAFYDGAECPMTILYSELKAIYKQAEELGFFK